MLKGKTITHHLKIIQIIAVPTKFKAANKKLKNFFTQFSLKKILNKFDSWLTIFLNGLNITFLRKRSVL